MKLIIENFRKFVINENSKVDTLIIYDFDETLGKVQNDFVEFIDKSGNVVKSIEPGDYDGYKIQQEKNLIIGQILKDQGGIEKLEKLINANNKVEFT